MVGVEGGGGRGGGVMLFICICERFQSAFFQAQNLFLKGQFNHAVLMRAKKMD